ncbi:MAG: 23S rRNA (guanosine(2251)-2'-O)-methyltransferase RlmB [Candidatus Pacebacteria bacterium]|nr:23S rRNA (guanosine(2251)-2'-O)-methyltransferase RlmB [Candidatus Paceibacterota bacterium]
MKQNKIYIYGKHAVTEAIRNRPEAVKKVYISSHINDTQLRELIRKTNIPSVSLEGNKSTRDIEESASHQGVIGVVSLKELMLPYKEFISSLSIGRDTALVLLDELQDPHNVGAVVRSAAAFGIGGILIPEHNQAPITGAVIKVSAGMAFRVPIISIGNVNQVMRDLKERGFWIYGLEGKGEKSVTNEKFDTPTVFVLGNESKGIRLKTRELCDILLSIPTNPKCESLNAAASAAVAFYAWSAQHQEVLEE